MTENTEARAAIGIDLGTTNCALAYTQNDTVEQFAIPQFVNPGEMREEPLLPSFLFLEKGELENGERDRGRAGAEEGTGERRQAGLLREIVALACGSGSHGGHSSPERTGRRSADLACRSFAPLSPAFARGLEHQKPGDSFDARQILVGVPASFDAVARDLTLKAAEEAGYRNVILLEEPQAAFYAWIERNPDWRELVGVGDLILVIDIGGGTTDFTLIEVQDRGGEIALERLAVGEHILLGGDNVDAALAHTVAEQLPKKLDTMQFHALWQHCRAAKEKLLAPGSKEKEEPITILGRGTGVVGGSLKTKLKRSDLEAILLDGFLPLASIDDVPQGQRAALTEFGLPYAADAAITRHLAQFLHHQGAKPTHVLFNGGVLRANLVRERILEVLNGWMPQPVKSLVSNDLMHAVARGAAYYGLARQGRGVRVRGGVPRSYYIGIEAAMPAVPGRKPPLKALTVVPFGMEEGTGHQIRDREFALSLGGRAQFRFFQSSERKDDPAGLLLEEIGARHGRARAGGGISSGQSRRNCPCDSGKSGHRNRRSGIMVCGT